ncbi:MAG: BrnT family toxin [Nitrospira sp.]|nr:BrnT family toxin [Nitrospira sp.]
MATWLFVEWLLTWILDTTTFAFEWDQGNRTKNATKHDVTTDEVESVFRLKRAVPLGVQTSPIVNELRLGLVGQSDRERVLQIAFTFRGSKIRVISARPAHRKERSQYDTMAREIFPNL